MGWFFGNKLVQWIIVLAVLVGLLMVLGWQLGFSIGAQGVHVQVGK